VEEEISRAGLGQGDLPIYYKIGWSIPCHID
jgi:hypothetical protein